MSVKNCHFADVALLHQECEISHRRAKKFSVDGRSWGSTPIIRLKQLILNNNTIYYKTCCYIILVL